MKTYRRLSRNERDEIARLLARKWSIRKIAFLLSRSHTTLSRELRRNKRKGYGPIEAHLEAYRRQHKTHRPPPKLANDVSLQKRVKRELKKGWSPEIIAGLLKRENGRCVVGDEAIYRWIYSDARKLILCLVRSHRRRQHRYARPWPKRLIPQRVSIVQRPLEINLRQVPGHWETDLVWGAGRCALQVSVERQTRFVRLRLLRNKTAQASYEGLADVLVSLPSALRKSITYANASSCARSSASLITPGKKAPLKTPMASFDAAYQSGPTSIVSLLLESSASRIGSIRVLVNAFTSIQQHRLSGLWCVDYENSLI